MTEDEVNCSHQGMNYVEGLVDMEYGEYGFCCCFFFSSVQVVALAWTTSCYTDQTVGWHNIQLSQVIWFNIIVKSSP